MPNWFISLEILKILPHGKPSAWDKWAILGLFTLVSCLFIPNILTGTYPVDPFMIEVAQIHSPWKSFVRETFAMGRFPLWLPRLAFGYPVMEHSHSIFFYPPSAVFLFFDFLPAMSALIFFHLLLIAIGVYALSRALGNEPAGSFCGSVLMALGGYVMSQTGYMPVFLTMSWSPLILLVAGRIIIRQGMMTVIALAMLSTLQYIAGDTEMVIYQWLLIFVCISTISILYPGSVSGRSLYAIFLSIALVGILAAIQFLPLVELFSQSNRQAAVSLKPIIGNPAGPGWVFTPIFHMGSRLIAPIPLLDRYPNMPFAATALGIIGWFSLDRKMKWVVAIAFLFCVINAIQHLSPMQRLFNVLPVLRGLRFPIRLFFFAHLIACLLAARAVGYIRVNPGALRKIFITAAPALAAYSVVYYRWGPSKTAAIILFSVAASLFIAGLAGTGRLKFAASMLVALLIADPFITAVHQLPKSDKDVMTPYPEVVRLFKNNLEGPNAFSRALIVAHERDGRFTSGQEIGWGGFTPADTYSLHLKRYFLFFSLLVPTAFKFDPAYDKIIEYNDYDFSMNFYDRDLLEISSLPWMELAGLRYLLVKGRDFSSFIPRVITETERFKRLDLGPGMIDVYENPNAYPRAFFAYEPVIVPDYREAIKFMRLNPDTDFRKSIIFESDRAHSTQAYSKPEESNAPAIVKYLPDEVWVKASPKQPAYLVLTDTYAPGWRLHVDGREEKIMPADGLFRAVNLSAGTHELVFRYVPVPFRIGLWMSIAGLLAMLAMVGVLIGSKAQS